MPLCKCNLGLLNTGLAACAPSQLPQVFKKLGLINLVANDGTVNRTQASNVNNLTWATALINNADVSKRLFVTPEFKNITTTKADAVFETFDDDSKFFVREGLREFKGGLPKCPPRYKTVLESARCNVMGTYFFDTVGNQVGLLKVDKFGVSDGYLYPIPFNTQSVYANVQFATDKTNTDLMVQFDFPTYIDDGLFGMITANDFPDFNWNTLQGMITAIMSQQAAHRSTTTFSVQINTLDGGIDSIIAVPGLVKANFTLYDITSAAAIVITSTTEDATTPGLYHFVIPVTTNTDILQLTPLLPGIDFSQAPTVAIALS